MQHFYIFYYYINFTLDNVAYRFQFNNEFYSRRYHGANIFNPCDRCIFVLLVINNSFLRN